MIKKIKHHGRQNKYKKIKIKHHRLLELCWRMKRRERLTQRFPLRKPSEFMALWARSKNDMLNIKPAAKPFISHFTKSEVRKY
jgi:hypothetical protein